MLFHLSYADCVGKKDNCSYPHDVEITDEAALAAAVRQDYVGASYQVHYRNVANFLRSDCLLMDCDNDHSENPEEWVHPSDIAEAFPGVAFAVHYSRHHMQIKDDKPARPKFHVFFPIDPVSNADEYSGLKKRVFALFPFFDSNALDAARFFFGTPDPQVEMFDGPIRLTDHLSGQDFDAALPAGTYGEQTVIPEGSRNTTLSRYAAKLLKRLGPTEKALKSYLKYAGKCDPPLDPGEIDTIWQSALRFYDRIAGQPGYIPPEEYREGLTLKPDDYSDVGQAVVLSREYIGRLRYSPATDYLVYNGSFWDESKPKAQGIAQELTTRQLEEANDAIEQLIEEMKNNGAWDLVTSMGKKKAPEWMTPEQQQSFRKYEEALSYRYYTIKRRDSDYITSALKEARPMVEIRQEDLDADPFLLNTPSATYDLRQGLESALPHDPNDFITKQTAVDPNNDNAQIWQDALNTFFLGDQDLIRYVQEIAGLSAIGKVCLEALIIAYGEGRNGKSTFWNTLSRVMGNYSGNISADTLTVGCKRNVKPEMAEARGKRLLIAAELEEGMRLSTSNVKQLCSTDEIFAEKKYKAPFSFVPTHTLVLYTNHLPKVGALDAGTWRRLIVVPFNAVIQGNSDIRNYADYLFEQCGGVILSWIIEGARRAWEKNYHLDQPRIVEEAIRRYKENNDWLSQFLDDRCEIDPTYMARSGELYTEYRTHCIQTGEYTRSTTDFYSAVELAGFEKKRTKDGVMIRGLRLKSDFLNS